MGGRGSSSGISENKSKKSVRKIEGISGYFTTYADVAKSSKNTIWIANTKVPHASLNTDEKSVHIKGNKKNPYALLENVNTAKVVLSGVNKDNPTREVNKLKKQINEIKSLGFDVPKIYVGSDESFVFVKRKLFTKYF